MIIKKHHYFTIGLTLLLVGALYTAQCISRNDEATHSIVLTENGFVPSSITITRGETVEFSTERDRPFWPASNEHPSHSEYADFDAKREVPPDETWQFTFSKPGEWGFHDHLYSFYEGVITVE